jgi:hypothetical protein
MGRSIRLRTLIAALVFGLLAGLVPPPGTPSAEALDPFTAGIAIFRIFQGMARRAQTYEDIAQARDEALAQLADERAIVLHQKATGVLGGRDVVRELARIKEAEGAIIALAERLKKLTKQQTDRFIGSTVLNAALLQLSATSGFIKTVKGIDGFFTSAEAGITRMLENVAGAGGDTLAQINAIQQQLSLAAGLLDTIGGPGGRKLSAQLADLERVIAEGISKAEDVRSWATQELAQALDTVKGLHNDVNTMVADVQQWRPGGLNLDLSRFNDETTLQLIAEVNALDGSRNAEAIIAGYATRAMERVRQAAEGGAVSLSVEDLRTVAAMAGQIYLAERLGPPKRKPASWELDLFVWQALNTWLALTGRDPLTSTDFSGSRHSASACDEAEPGFEHTWSIDLTQDVGGVVTGTLRYHACPDGGRATYDVTGIATTADSIELHAVKAAGQGPLGQTAPTQQRIWITPEGAPSKQYAPPEG